MLIKTTRSLVSLGTEKMLIDFGKSGYFAKARSQPDKVKQVIQKIKTDGLLSTVEAVKAKLDVPIALGYCNVGRVVEADAESEFAVGQRVISNGPHAEMISVSENLVAKIPDDVTDDAAAYAVVASIALQGIRLLEPTLGERVVVTGLGLIGLLSIQLLRAHGCQVLGVDFDSQKLELAKSFGASVVDLGAGQDPVRMAQQWTSGEGVDGVLITASAKTDEIVHQAATMCRKRGRIVLVGVVGLNLRRSDFYEKELSFQVSCSYGPGRYDANYEKKGLDYPIGFVRWTEQRNFRAVLDLLSEGRLQTDPLTTHQFSFTDALDGYAAIKEHRTMGVLLEYPAADDDALFQRSVTLERPQTAGLSRSQTPVIAFLGAGAFTTKTLLPKLGESAVRHTIISSTGTSAAYAAKKFGFSHCGSDAERVYADPSIDTVFITTPHHTHAAMVLQALDHGKHVFVEKPLALTPQDLDRIEAVAAERPGQYLMVGFNRRFSSHTQKLLSWLESVPGPKSAIITVNAGMIPAEHWTQDRQVGGGRIIGEGCHFIDLARCLIGAPMRSVVATAMSRGDGVLGDCASIQLAFTDGSIAVIHYLANGNKSFPKERVEVFAGGKVVLIDNFKRSRSFGLRESHKTFAQDKGHARQLSSFLEAVANGGTAPIPLAELLEVSRMTVEADRQIQDQIAQFG